jgi:hypothetical protein
VGPALTEVDPVVSTRIGLILNGFRIDPSWFMQAGVGTERLGRAGPVGACWAASTPPATLSPEPRIRDRWPAPSLLTPLVLVAPAAMGAEG